ncbi:MAG: cache domain-containing protein [Halopseudomonas sp.]
MTKIRPLKLWTLLFILVAMSMAALYGILLATDAVRQEAREQFFEQYNRQQQLMAEQASEAVEVFFGTLKRSLGLVSSLFENHQVDLARALEVEGSLVKLNQSLADSAIIDLVVFDRDGTVVAIQPSDPYTLGRNYAWRDYYLWARDIGKPGQMYASPFVRLEGGQNRGDKALIVAQGIYDQDGAFNGVAMFTVNFDELARKHILPVRIGEHGYAWLADINNKTLLVDPHGAVAGRSFEEAFLPQWPKLYSVLTSAQYGGGGTDWYRYEDPADHSQAVRKLLGYQTLKIGDHLWFIGVATPEREVDQQLSSFLHRQEAFSLTLVISILAGTVIISGLLLAWNRMLWRRVEVRTGDLARARSQLEDTFDELLESKKLAAVGHLALGLTHEIRNPLSAIRMNIKMIRKKWQPEGRLQEHFSIIDSEILRLNQLLSDVMDFAQPGPLRLENNDLNELVQRVRLLLLQRLDEEQVALDLSMPSPLLAVCDAGQIEQVLLNLFLNALDAMKGIDGEKRLSIVGACADGMVWIDVTDNGSGIRPEDRDKLFDPFFTTKPAGGGLGLCNLQSIMLRHQGSVEIVDTAERGACFRIRLPANRLLVNEPTEIRDNENLS